jgi:hypothetical protein
MLFCHHVVDAGLYCAVREVWKMVDVRYAGSMIGGAKSGRGLSRLGVADR